MPITIRARQTAFAAATALLVLAAPLRAALAHEGHDHGAPAPAAQAGVPASPRVTMVSEAHQFVGIVAGDRMTIYLDRAADNAPVTTARVEVSLDGESHAARLRSDGAYEIIAQSLRTPGEKETLVTITDGDASDLLVGALAIPDPAGAKGAGVFARALHAALPAGARNALTGAGLIGIGLAFGLALGSARSRRRRAALGVALAVSAALVASAAMAHEGHDHAPAPNAATTQGDAPHRRADGAVFLPKPSQRLLDVRTHTLQTTSVAPTIRFNGRVIADPRRSGLVQSTIAGRYVAPEGGAPPQGASVKAGQSLGSVRPAFASIDSSQLLQSLAELDQQIALNRQRLARQEPLLKSNAVPATQVEETRFLLAGQVARRRELIDSMSREEELVAPVDGVIAAARAVAGQVVGSADRLFEIVDPARPLVEALVFDPSILDRLGDASMTLADGARVRLRYLTRSRTLQQQYTSVQFEALDHPRALDIGQPVSIEMKVGAETPGLIVPRAALTQAPNGQTVVFEHSEPEIFTPRPVRTEPLDAQNVRVVAGLKEGDKIVVRNAPLVNQVR